MLLFNLLFSLFSLLTGEGQTAQLLFAGDAMQHQAQIDAARRSDGSYNYDDCFKALTPYISAADYAVVNLETPLGGAPYSGYPQFCAPDSYLKALTDAGFDLMLAANNHTLDRRDKGVVRTIEQFEKAGVPFVGIYRNKAHRQSLLPVIKDVNVFKIAVLNYTYGTNGLTVKGDVVVDYIDRKQMERDIKVAREAGAEIVAVCVHWGVEYQLLPHPTQTSLADFLPDQGVDLIIGGHPHVIQPMEIRHSDKHDKDVFLDYSLGNFISAMRTADTRGGAVARVRLVRDGAGKARVESADYRLVFVQPPTGPHKNFELLPADGTVAQQWSGARDAFVRNATRIFDKHNVNVPRDTSSILLKK